MCVCVFCQFAEPNFASGYYLMCNSTSRLISFNWCRDLGVVVKEVVLCNIYRAVAVGINHFDTLAIGSKCACCATHLSIKCIHNMTAYLRMENEWFGGDSMQRPRCKHEAAVTCLYLPATLACVQTWTNSKLFIIISKNVCKNNYVCSAVLQPPYILIK